MPSARHYSGACPPIPRLTYLPYNRAKTFMPYFSTKKHVTGRGLSLVQRIIVDHHGSIVLVTADATFGATLRIELPLEQSQAIRMPQTQ